MSRTYRRKHTLTNSWYSSLNYQIEILQEECGVKPATVLYRAHLYSKDEYPKKLKKLKARFHSDGYTIRYYNHRVSEYYGETRPTRAKVRDMLKRGLDVNLPIPKKMGFWD